MLSLTTHTKIRLSFGTGRASRMGKFVQRINLKNYSRAKSRKLVYWRRVASGSGTIVIVEESPQARPCFNDGLALSYILICMNDTATQSLVVPLDVVGPPIYCLMALRRCYKTYRKQDAVANDSRKGQDFDVEEADSGQNLPMYLK